MPAPSLARNFFNRIVEAPDPVLAIRAILNTAEPVFEQHWLDFKGEEPSRPGKSPDLKQQDKSNRKAWSEYLSAFANTGGGVVFWGLDCRKMQVEGRELDFAGGEALFTDPIGLASKLIEWLGQATDPPLGGVEIRPFAVPEDSTRGYVVCFVPEGTFKPYQSLLTENKQYYHRAGSSNFVMPKSMLSSLFYPSPKAVFRAKANAEFKWVTNAKPAQLVCRFFLQNVGTATAKDVYVRVTWSLPGKKEGMKEIGGVCHTNKDDEFAFMSSSLFHPDFEAQVLYATWTLDPGIADRIAATPHTTITTIQFAVFTHDQMPQTIKLNIDLPELVLKEKASFEAAAEG